MMTVFNPINQTSENKLLPFPCQFEVNIFLWNSIEHSQRKGNLARIQKMYLLQTENTQDVGYRLSYWFTPLQCHRMPSMLNISDLSAVR